MGRYRDSDGPSAAELSRDDYEGGQQSLVDHLKKGHGYGFIGGDPDEKQARDWHALDHSVNGLAPDYQHAHAPEFNDRRGH